LKNIIDKNILAKSKASVQGIFIELCSKKRKQLNGK